MQQFTSLGTHLSANPNGKVEQLGKLFHTSYQYEYQRNILFDHKITLTDKLFCFVFRHTILAPNANQYRPQPSRYQKYQNDNADEDYEEHINTIPGEAMWFAVASSEFQIVLKQLKCAKFSTTKTKWHNPLVSALMWKKKIKYCFHIHSKITFFFPLPQKKKTFIYLTEAKN